MATEPSIELDTSAPPEYRIVPLPLMEASSVEVARTLVRLAQEPAVAATRA